MAADLRPGILLAFGWRVVQIFTKDWHHDPASVLRQIDDALAGVTVEPVEIESPPPAAPHMPPPQIGEDVMADAETEEFEPPEAKAPRPPARKPGRHLSSAPPGAA